MKKRHIAAAVAAGIVGVLGWYVWPAYGFFSHSGDMPLPPYGWLKMDEAPPAAQEVLLPQYAKAGDRALAALAERREAIGAPGMSAAVWAEGQIVWRGQVGWADIKSETPVDADTQFRVGSTSKAITATALARMVQRGAIDLDAPISTYLGELPNEAWATITPRQLASHMAGMPHYGENGESTGLYAMIALRKEFRDVRDAVKLFDESPLLSEPGTEFYYSSLGTVLLGAVMSEAAGKPYRQLIADEVLAPAEADATIVAPKRKGKNADLATFYLLKDDRQRPWRPVDLSHRLPGGGWASTPSDLVRIGALWLDDGFIGPDTRQMFWTPQKLNNGETNEQDYALGFRWREWQLDGAPLARNANHGGVSRGAQCWFLIFPDQEMVMAFSINSRTDEFFDFAEIWEEVFLAFTDEGAE